MNAKFFGTLLAAGMMVACGQPEAETKTDTGTTTEATTSSAETYTIDTETSRIYWKGSMLGMHSHEGTLSFTQGSLIVVDEEIVGGAFEVDMTTITPTDDGYNEENPKEKLIGHLSSEDFFDVANHPNASLQLMEGGVGELTIRGITNTENIKGIEARFGGESMKAMAELIFDRTKYDVSFVHPVQEMVLSDDIELRIELVANK